MKLSELKEQYRDAQRAHGDAFYVFGIGHPDVVAAYDRKEKLRKEIVRRERWRFWKNTR